MPSTADKLRLREEYRLMAGDVIELELPGQEDITGEYTLDPSGAIHIPVVGFVNLDKLTFSEAEDALAGELTRYYASNALNLKIKSYQNNEFVVIMGAVEEPGLYSIRNDLSLLKAIGMAKGFRSSADMRNIQIVRNNGAGKSIRIDVKKLVKNADFSKDLILRKDDVVFIPERPLNGLLNGLAQYLPFVQVTLLTLVTLSNLSNG
jgi:polysaccharide export outer membrane protein